MREATGSTSGNKAAMIAWLSARAHKIRTWLTSPFDILVICYSLLFLYALPLIVIIAAFAMSGWFSSESPLIEFSISLAALYASEVRESLGTFVVPFVTAYAVAGVQKSDRLEARTTWLFLTLTLLFLMAIVVNGAIRLKVDVMIAQTGFAKAVSIEAKDNLLLMSKAYVKEILVYISLLIGISRAGAAGEKT